MQNDVMVSIYNPESLHRRMDFIEFTWSECVKQFEETGMLHELDVQAMLTHVEHISQILKGAIFVHNQNRKEQKSGKK